MARRRLALLLVMLGALTLAACSSNAPREPVHLTLRPYARTGQVDGYWQTPRGGMFGSSSPKRPTFDEVGVEDSQEYGMDAHVDWGPHRVKLGAARQTLYGSGVLAEDLTSQNSFFPAGTVIDSDSSIDWVQAHYQYRINVPLGRCDCLKLYPGAGYKWAVLHHVMDGDNGARVSRHHSPGMPNLILDAEWRPRGNRNLRLTGSAAQSISIGDEPRVNDVVEILGRIHYDFGRRGGLFLETGYRDVFIRDDQPDMQNWLNMQYGPWVGIGGEIKF